ncbi:MAG TPA: hypothetical protein VN682_15565 [Terriglobales bacterium]|nr:hypothetical protein [Terriglobales bacterium]
MRITVIARRFENGSWLRWEHVCDAEEADGVLDSANAEAFSRSFSNVPIDSDYLEGARYIFDRAYGTREKPAEGDLRVTSVNVSIVAEMQTDDSTQNFVHKKSA